jgi:hypothetical protein
MAWSKQFLAHCILLISHPSYSPDQVQAKFWPYPPKKIPLSKDENFRIPRTL